MTRHNTTLYNDCKKVAKILCCRHSTENHEPNQMYHVTEMKNVGTLPPYRSVIGCAPPPTKLSGFGSQQPYNFDTLGVHPLHTSVLRSSCLETYQVSAVLGPSPLLCSRVLLLLGVSDLLPVSRRSVSGFRTW